MLPKQLFKENNDQNKPFISRRRNHLSTGSDEYTVGSSSSDETLSSSSLSSSSPSSSVSNNDLHLTSVDRSMQAEVDAAVNFLTYLLVKARHSTQTSESFRKSLTDLLIEHYADHWYPDEPLRGSGYRCLRVNGVMHPILAAAACLCNLPLVEFRRAFPAELTVWIDPGDVNVRIGEEGSIGVYFAKNGSIINGTPTSVINHRRHPNQHQSMIPGSAPEHLLMNSKRQKMSTNRRRLNSTHLPVTGRASMPDGSTTPVRHPCPVETIRRRISPTVLFQQAAIGVENTPSPMVNCSLQSSTSQAIQYQLYENVHVGKKHMPRLSDESPNSLAVEA